MPESSWTALLIPTIAPLATITLSAILGHRLTVFWAARQKRRELQLNALSKLYELYGEFFAIWKLWNYYKKREKSWDGPPHTTWLLLQRSCAAEAGMEALFVRLATEWPLSDEDCAMAGGLRQAFQQLRKCIKRNEPLEWWAANQHEYITFKSRFCQMALKPNKTPRDPAQQEATKSLLTITSNIWETQWLDFKQPPQKQTTQTHKTPGGHN